MMDRQLIGYGLLLLVVGPACYQLRISTNFMPELWWWFRIKCAVCLSLGVFFLVFGLFHRGENPS